MRNVGFNTAKSDDYWVGQGSYELLHARLAFTDIDARVLPGNVEFAFVGRNLTDKSYRVGGYGADLSATYGPGNLWYTNVYGPPRFVGGEIVYRWGSQG
jgi:outer membrane receptor protein involved in Fe transport